MKCYLLEGEGVRRVALPGFRFIMCFPVPQTTTGIGLRAQVTQLVGLAIITLNLRNTGMTEDNFKNAQSHYLID